MNYASSADIETLYGAPFLALVADLDGDGDADSAVIERALEDAHAQADAYIGARYNLPLDEAPLALRRPVVDIAVYVIAQSADRMTDEIAKRYVDAIQFLRDVSQGRAALNIGAADSNNTGLGAPRIQSSPRLFSREGLKGL